VKKGLLSITACAVILSLSGCGGGGGGDGSSNTTSTTQIASGVVADGHIKGATVFVDLNHNSVKDANEPSTTTDSNGNYLIKVDGGISNDTPIIAQGGFDLLRNTSFSGKLYAFFGSDASISPITTLVYKYKALNGVSIDNAVGAIASKLGISNNDVLKDPTSNSTLQTLSLQTELSAELLATLKDKDLDAIYDSVAKSASSASNLKDMFLNIASNNNTKLAVSYLIDNVSKISPNRLDFVKNELALFIDNANKNNKVLTIDDITAYMDYVLNYKLSFSFEDIKSYYNSFVLNAQQASVGDVKNLVSLIRDTIYEFIDPNADTQPTSTIVGEVSDAYENAIVPAVEKLDSNLSSDIKYINDSINDFSDEFDKEFNVSITHLNDRLSELSDGIKSNDSVSDYNFTTSFGDTLIHKYTNDSGKITEIYSLNDQNLTVTYDENDTNTMEFSGTVNIASDEYNITLDKISLTNIQLDIEGYGYVDGNNSSKLTLKKLLITSTANRSVLDNSDSYDDYEVAQNPTIDLWADITMPNSSFSGKILIDSKGATLRGSLVYNDFHFDGNLTLGPDYNTLAKLVIDNNFKVSDNDEIFGKLILVNGSPIIKLEYYNRDWQYYDDGWISKYDVNLTSIKGDTTHCYVKHDVNSSTDTTNHIVNCDNPDEINETNIYKKIVSFDINGSVYTAMESLIYIDKQYCNSDEEIEFLKYNFENAEIMVNDNNESVLETSSLVSTDPDIRNFYIKEAANIYNLPTTVSLQGVVTTPNTQLELNLSVITSENNSYSIIANNVKLYNSAVGDNKITISSLELDYNHFEKEVFYPWLSSWSANYADYYIESYVDDENDLTNVKLEGLNATLYDENGNPLKLTNFNVSYDKDTNNTQLQGEIKYLDLSLDGYLNSNYTNNLLSFYLDTNKTGYAPLTIGLYSSSNSGDELLNGPSTGYFLIQRRTDALAGKFDTNSSNTYVNVVSNKGVFIDVKDEGGEASVSIKDANGNTLATYNPDTREIIYSDGTSETLY